MLGCPVWRGCPSHDCRNDDLTRAWLRSCRIHCIFVITLIAFVSVGRGDISDPAHAGAEVNVTQTSTVREVSEPNTLQLTTTIANNTTLDLLESIRSTSGSQSYSESSTPASTTVLSDGPTNGRLAISTTSARDMIAATVPTTVGAATELNSTSESTTEFLPDNGRVNGWSASLIGAMVCGSIVGAIAIVLLALFVAYRRRKKDEGSYALVGSESLALHTHTKLANEYYA